MDHVAFQHANCHGCIYADNPALHTGKPCCTIASETTTDGSQCMSKVTVLPTGAAE